MADTKSEGVKMLASLIDDAASGKNVELSAKPTREVVRLRRENQDVDTLFLSIEYSGTVDGKPFTFKKNYSFAEDEAQYALECLLVANNRLQMDYKRLHDAGIAGKETFFTFQNSFLGLPGGVSTRKPVLRLQDFIHLSRVGASVSVDVVPKIQEIVLMHENVEKKGFACITIFTFAIGEEKTTIEKLYTLGSFEDKKEYQAEIREVANKRLERDCERLRREGITVAKSSF